MLHSCSISSVTLLSLLCTALYLTDSCQNLYLQARCPCHEPASHAHTICANIMITHLYPLCIRLTNLSAGHSDLRFEKRHQVRNVDVR